MLDDQQVAEEGTQLSTTSLEVEDQQRGGDTQSAISESPEIDTTPLLKIPLLSTLPARLRLKLVLQSISGLQSRSCNARILHALKDCITDPDGNGDSVHNIED